MLLYPEPEMLIWLRHRPDPSMLNPQDFIAPRNGFAMPTRDFLMHIIGVLDQLGLSIQARTNFIK